MLISTLAEFFLEAKKRGIKKKDVAEKIGVSDPYISKMLSGEKPITDSFKAAIRKYYGDILKEVEDLEEIGKEVQFTPSAIDYDVPEGKEDHSVVNDGGDTGYNTQVIEEQVDRETIRSLSRSIEQLTRSKETDSETLRMLVKLLEASSGASTERSQPTSDLKYEALLDVLVNVALGKKRFQTEDEIRMFASHLMSERFRAAETKQKA